MSHLGVDLCHCFYCSCSRKQKLRMLLMLMGKEKGVVEVVVDDFDDESTMKKMMWT